jgi:uncharacterized protein
MPNRSWRSAMGWTAAFVLVAVAKNSYSQTPPENLLLKNYRPKSIYAIPVTEVPRAKFAVIDVHAHPDAKTAEEVATWVKNMDEANIERTVIMTMAVGAKFDSIYDLYSRYPDRFQVWCGFDFTGYDKPGFGPSAVAELERCVRKGAKGVGELGDKGKGLFYGDIKAWGMHPDDPRMDPLFDKCAELGLPVNLHVADPIWMYQPMDSTNDGLMNAVEWRLDNQPGIVGHAGMMEILEKTVARHPRTTFIACHFANLCYNLREAGRLLDTYPNLYMDNGARYAETAATPRAAAGFYRAHPDRILYGTDMGFDLSMYRTTFRILETLDEHFYENERFGYHWYLNGFGLEDAVLEKVYRTNALKVLKK